MSIFPKITKTGAVGANRASLNSNEASYENPFLTEDDLGKDGIVYVIFVAPNGSKWKKSIDDSGNFVTTAV